MDENYDLSWDVIGEDLACSDQFPVFLIGVVRDVEVEDVRALLEGVGLQLSSLYSTYSPFQQVV